MNKSEHAYDPALGLLYTRQIEGKHRQFDDARELFYQLNQSGNNQQLMHDAYDFVAQHINQAGVVYKSLEINQYNEEFIVTLTAPQITPLPEALQTQDNFNLVINQLAAIHLTQPCWLQNIVQISCSQSATTMQLMAVYLQLVGAGQNGANIQQLYRALLLAGGHEPPILYSSDYCQQAELMSEIFDFGSIQLALARFPRVLFAEILGFTLAYCQMPALLEICFPEQLQLASFVKLRKQQTQQQILPLQACISSYLNLFPEQKQQLWQRIQSGFWLYQQQMQICKDRMQHVLQTPLSINQTIVRLLQQKASAAIGHHQKIQLQGKTLDIWFAELPANSHEFLQALMQSGYINKQDPLDSPLLKLFNFNGPMFGVLDRSELNILKNWLKSESNKDSMSIVEESKKSFTSDFKATSLIKQTQQQYAKLSNRQLYYYLLNADLFPDVLPIARIKVRNRLQACAWLNPLPFKHYTHQHFDSYIDTIYQREMSAYKPLQAPPKISREAYIWGLEQIAPIILIDGCWLQNSLALQAINPEICDILFKIYCDEIGNARLQQNHPHIFQQLLESLSIQVPPVYSKAFVKHPGFINSAFDLPVYMLSLSSFSIEFLPELLGLNMAIELSGLGKSYMSLVDDWNYWGIDPSIANIHISIDNAASGHTFLAKKAIKLYMDELINNTAERASLDRHWRRIYTGYASLRFVGARFKLGLPMGYLFNKYRVKHRY